MSVLIPGKPPHPIPTHMRERLHRKLDELLNAYEWDAVPWESTFAWEAPESRGEVRILVREGSL